MPGCSAWKAASAAGSPSASAAVAATRARPRTTPACSSIAARAAATSGQDRVGALEQVGARRRELDALRRPGQERDAELLLEAEHLLGHRGLREVQGVGGAGDVPVAGDRGEGLELAEVHRGRAGYRRPTTLPPRELRARDRRGGRPAGAWRSSSSTRDGRPPRADLRRVARPRAPAAGRACTRRACAAATSC